MSRINRSGLLFRYIWYVLYTTGVSWMGEHKCSKSIAGWKYVCSASSISFASHFLASAIMSWNRCRTKSKSSRSSSDSSWPTEVGVLGCEPMNQLLCVAGFTVNNGFVGACFIVREAWILVISSLVTWRWPGNVLSQFPTAFLGIIRSEPSCFRISRSYWCNACSHAAETCCSVCAWPNAVALIATNEFLECRIVSRSRATTCSNTALLRTVSTWFFNVLLLKRQPSTKLHIDLPKSASIARSSIHLTERPSNSRLSWFNSTKFSAPAKCLNKVCFNTGRNILWCLAIAFNGKWGAYVHNFNTQYAWINDPSLVSLYGFAIFDIVFTSMIHFGWMTKGAQKRRTLDQRTTQAPTQESDEYWPQTRKQWTKQKKERIKSQATSFSQYWLWGNFSFIDFVLGLGSFSDGHRFMTRPSRNKKISSPLLWTIDSDRSLPETNLSEIRNFGFLFSLLFSLLSFRLLTRVSKVPVRFFLLVHSFPPILDLFAKKKTSKSVSLSLSLGFFLEWTLAFWPVCGTLAWKGLRTAYRIAERQPNCGFARGWEEPSFRQTNRQTNEREEGNWMNLSTPLPFPLLHVLSFGVPYLVTLYLVPLAAPHLLVKYHGRDLLKRENGRPIPEALGVIAGTVYLIWMFLIIPGVDR